MNVRESYSRALEQDNLNESTFLPLSANLTRPPKTFRTIGRARFPYGMHAGRQAWFN